jgi:hypothetical protein
MMRPLAGLLALTVAGLPLLTWPSALTAGLAALAAALCAGGILVRIPPFVTAGAVVGLLEYAVALWARARSPDILTALAFGVALALLLQVVDFAARVRGAAVESRVLWALARYWVAAATAAAGVGVGLVALAGHLRLGLPSAALPVMSAIGALAALVGVLGGLQGAGVPVRESVEGP